MRGHHRRFRGARARRLVGPGEWAVRARIERFGEPALLLLLSERPAHGYDLLEQLPELTREERIDMGNLYRVLRALEEEGLVTSEWRDNAPGPTRRRARAPRNRCPLIGPLHVKHTCSEKVADGLATAKVVAFAT